MRSRMLFKLSVPGHDYHSPQNTHIWIELKRTDKSIIYECAMCDRHHQRKLAGRRRLFKMQKIRKIMEKALA